MTTTSVPRALHASVRSTELSKNGKCGERIRTPLAEYGDNPERKNTPCISDLAGVKFLLKKERVFFFRGSALQVFGQAECKCNSDSVFAKTIFWGKDFAKPRLICFGGNSDWVSRAEEGSGEESARTFCSDFLAESEGKISGVWDLCAKIEIHDLI